MLNPRRGRLARQELEEQLASTRAELERVGVEREHLAAVLMAIPDAVIAVDRNCDEVLRNAAAERFRNARHSDVLAEDEIARALRTALGGRELEHEVQLFGPPAETLQVRAVPVRDGEGVSGAVAFVRDVSEIHRVDSMRRDFVANVTHELKTPIGALALLAETMSAGGYDPTVNRQLSEQLVREADRLADIVDDLLDLSLIEAQRAVRKATSVRPMVDEAIDRVRALAQANRITLCPPVLAEDLVVHCDARQMVIALANLLDNAVKYSDEGQAVELRARRDGRRLVIEVRDEGIGIPSRDLERVFERFYRVDKARSRATGGTGLGLSIVRHVAESHGGDVTVQSVEGEGSTFTLRIVVGDAGNQVS
jgi:two-component system sensor histidine kinase SenX3